MNHHPTFSIQSPPATDFVACLSHWAQQRAAQPAFLFLNNLDEVTQVTYSELDRKARAIAVRLTALGLKGERALLYYPPGLDFIEAFFGCLYAGTIAVPALPPRRNRNMARIEAISIDSRAAIVLTMQDVNERSISLLDDDAAYLRTIPWLATDQVAVDIADCWQATKLDDETLAVLQYTSGSTGRPKGVMLSHANLLHNCSLITHAFNADQDSIGLSWLPTYHDMGLVGGILNPVFIGRPNIFMSPMSFLQRPIRWLQNISRFRVSISGAPNFAYALCTEKINDTDCEGLDLSSWTVAFNGAEPVRADTLAVFSEKFKPYGFRDSAFFPCYGMAESTLIISGADRQQPPMVRTFDAGQLESNLVVPVCLGDKSARQLVSSGHVLPGQRVVIVDPAECLQLPIDRVGEIWVQSGSVAQGYWNDSVETERVFHARLSNDDSEDGRFLRTGDLGFFHEGQLFVTGRTKDLIIINGRNLYPHDVESIVERAHEAVRIGGGAAFSIDVEDSEQLVIAQELVREYQHYDIDAIMASIREAVFDFLDVSPHSIVLLKVGKLPKTSSGKVQRRACRDGFLAAQLDVLAHWQPGEATIVGRNGAVKTATVATARVADTLAPESIQAWLINRIAKQLNTAPSKIDVEETFAYFGLDSLTLVGISGELEDWLGHSIAPQLLFIYPTIAELSNFLATSNSTDSSSRVPVQTRQNDEPVARFTHKKNELLVTKPGKSALEILDGLDEMSAAETVEMLKQLLREKSRQEVTSGGLSYGQSALWFIYHIDRTSSAYNIMYATQVHADLDRDAFCRAFQAIVNRHAVLRTTYAMVDGLPEQQVHPYRKFVLQTVDARSWSHEELDAGIQSLADAAFDLEQGPVLRVQLLERSDGQHVMLFVVHHIAFDYWSLDLLVDELESLYREETNGSKSELPIAAVTYCDFVYWQESVLRGPEGDRLWDYWQRELDGPLPILDLPTDYPRPLLQSFRGRSFEFKLSDMLTRRLTELSKSEGVSLFTTFLAAFQVLLYRYSGQQDIVVGCPTHGRSRPEFQNVCGYFVNPIALRSKLLPEESFAVFLQQVRTTLVGGIAHQEFPFSMLVERLQIPRDPSRSPIFQVAVGWENPRRMQIDKTCVTSSNGRPDAPESFWRKPLGIRQRGSAFDLMLMLCNQGETVTASFQYNVDLYDETTMTRMAGHFERLLESIADDPKGELGKLPLLRAQERDQILEDWNATATEYADRRCLHEMIESQVAQFPDAIAVEFNGESLTYQELNERANQVAHYLADLGVGPDVLVGIYVDRSLEMMVGLLGIVKAGGAYIPLSPETPRNRLANMLDQSQASIVLTHRKLSHALPEFGGQMVCFDDDGPTIARQKTCNPICYTEPSNLAYVIFTSGSGGEPKGVQVEHRAVVNFLSSMQREPGISSNDVILAVTTFTFDISVLELFLPLTVGARTVIARPGIATDGVQLSQAIVESKATIVQATPSTWRLLVEAGWNGDDRLKVLCGGEFMPSDLADSLLNRCGALWNMYGPTETTIWSTVELVEDRSESIPIGRPIANTQTYILDNRMQPVPIGVTGNLYIGGNGLARGYLGQPKLTAEKFIPNPFGSEQRSRLYNTGDLARYRADGKIEFLGREDFQVKMRGFRIELGEIEMRLNTHPKIRQSVVKTCERGSYANERKLVAYFTFTDEAPNPSDLRDFLKGNLPDYMIPAMFIPLDELPLGLAGKIDRGLLPQPDSARPGLRARFVAPRNDTEKKLTGIFSKVLGLDEVGIHDNFFELGGASMQSLEIASLAVIDGIKILPASIFQYPTIAELAANVSNQAFCATKGAKVAASRELSPQIVASRLELASQAKSKENSELKTKKTNAVIESLGVYLPPTAVATKDVVAGCKKKLLFPLEDMTGIKFRRVSADNEFTSDIACHAVAACLDNSKYTSDQIDLVICCHIGRDEQSNSAALEPGTAMYLKQRFRFANAVAFDISNACAGMFTGISIAESWLNTGAARRVLVVSAEHISPVMKTAQLEISEFVDPRISCLTLGDAGTAMILETGCSHTVGFQDLEMYTLSSYSSMCVGRPTEYAHGGPILVVPDPIKHTSIAIENSIAHAKILLERNRWNPENINWVILHQTSARSLHDGARAINKAFNQRICTKENTINNLRERGNTASTSHFVAVWDNILNGRIKSGDKVFFGITGSGQTIGTGLYTFDDLPDRIRQRTELGQQVKLVEQVGADYFPSSTGSPRTRAASVGVLDRKSSVARETMPMVLEAAKNCLQKSDYQFSELELVIFAGVYRSDFIFEPAMATMIAGELKINDAIKPDNRQRTFAFDVINGGLGMLNACDIATRMLRSGRIRTALVIASEVENNRDAYPDRILGLVETASAIILDQGGLSQVGFGEFVFQYLPEYLYARIVTGKYTSGKPLVGLEQDPAIAELFLSIIPKAVGELLRRERLSITDISVVLPPQFSGEFLDRLARVLDLDRDRFIDLTGDGKDWFTSSLPYSLHEIEIGKLAKSNDIGLVINVGSGLQVGCATYYF